MQYRLLAVVQRALRAALLFLGLLGMVGAPWGSPSAAAATPPAIVSLDSTALRVDIWPALTLLSEGAARLSADEALAAAGQFTPPTGAAGTLGLRKSAVWLRFDLQGPAGTTTTDNHWILDIDYAPLRQLDVHLAVADGDRFTWLQHTALGARVPVSERPLASREHAVALPLRAGARHVVLIRVETTGAMVLPITLRRPADFHRSALNEQMLQGVLGGLGLFLVLYSLVQWTSLREKLFAKYALLVTGSLWFSVYQFGVGAQYLWPGNLWMEHHSGGLAALAATCGSFLFIEHVLGEPGPDGRASRFSRFMRLGALTCVVLAALYALGLIGERLINPLVSLLGPVPALVGLPGAIARTRRGDEIGASFVVAWAVYFVATAVMVAMINGAVAVTPWTLHSFQIGATLDMLIFMRVVGLRMRAVQSAARQAALEHDALRSLAHTDPLTGLPNRRGLQAALSAALPAARPGHLLAVYMLDLDGFKPVNDQFGHDVGDELLVAVARRLRDSVRTSDLVSRLGGDEFVVMLPGLPSEDRAHESALQWVESFRRPFQLRQHTCTVGLTVGYALAPVDDSDPVALLKLADAAMYAGKQDGKGCARRARAAAAPAALEAPG